MKNETQIQTRTSDLDTRENFERRRNDEGVQVVYAGVYGAGETYAEHRENEDWQMIQGGKVSSSYGDNRGNFSVEQVKVSQLPLSAPLSDRERQAENGGRMYFSYSEEDQPINSVIIANGIHLDGDGKERPVRKLPRSVINAFCEGALVGIIGHNERIREKFKESLDDRMISPSPEFVLYEGGNE